MNRNNQLSLLVLMCINMMDSIMGAIVGPTLIFYVTELGGGKIEYGVMNSVFSVGSLFMISVYGTWVDTNGNKFVVPYMSSFAGGIIGNLIYFLAILLPKGPIALYTLIFSRLIVGMSSAGRNLSYIWVASAIPRDNQRTIFTFLTMTKIGGIIVGPLSNLLVSEIDTEFELFGLQIPVNPNNSIGLMMVVGEIILVIITLLFFQDPPEKKKEEDKMTSATGGADTTTKSEAKGFWYAIGHFNIIFPVFTIFCVASCFALAMFALSPVAKNVGWNTVQISEVTSLGSATMAGSLVLSAIISQKNVSDLAMISFGMTGFGVSGLLMYVWWDGTDIGYLHLAVPLCLNFFSYPFIGPANRSIFTKAIHDNPELEGSHGVLMGLINQAAALSGIMAPTLISLFVLRNQEEIDATPDNQHQVTLGVMYAPLFALLVLVGLMYQYIKTKNDDTSDTNDGVSDESTTLLLSKDGDSSKKKKSLPRARSLPRASILEISDAFSIQSEAKRRMSAECMGIPNPLETKYEQEFGEKLEQDRKNWEEIRQIDDAMED